VGGGGAGPAQGNIVLARKAGFIVDGETDLIGEDAGEIGDGLVGGAVDGRSAKDDSTAVVVRFAWSVAVPIGGGRERCSGGLAEFRAILGDDQSIAFHLLRVEVPGEAEAVFEQVLEHGRELLRGCTRGDCSQDVVGGAGKRRPCRELVGLQVEGFYDQGGEGTFGAAEHAGVSGARATGGRIGGEVKARLGRVGLDGGDLEFGPARGLCVSGHQEGGREHGDFDYLAHEASVYHRAVQLTDRNTHRGTNVGSRRQHHRPASPVGTPPGTIRVHLVQRG
jgi:hypothetical protein